MLRRLVIPEGVFADLARGRGGSRVGRWLTDAERGKHMLLIRGVIDAATAASPEQATEARKAYQDLAIIQQEFPDVVEKVICQPAVGAWALDTIRRIHRRENVGTFLQNINALVVATAIRVN